MLRARLGGIWYYYARSNSPSPPRDPHPQHCASRETPNAAAALELRRLATYIIDP